METMMAIFTSLIVFICLVTGHNCFSWTDTIKNGEPLRACVGSDVTIAWEYSLNEQEAMMSTEWFYEGQSQEMVAIFSHGSFVVLPSFSHRVQQANNGGLTLRHVTKADAGNYSIEVNGYGASGVTFTQRRTVRLIVEDSWVMSSDGDLHVTQSRSPVHNDVTDQWSLQLMCGNFSMAGQPSFDVQWTTPSGKVMNSSGYSDNQFQLLVDGPLQGGTYRCEIPSSAAHLVCLPAGQPLPQAQVMVDGPSTRLMLMEAEQTTLRQRYHQLLEELQQLKGDNQQLRNTLSLVQQRELCTVHGAAALNNTCATSGRSQLVVHVATTKLQHLQHNDTVKFSEVIVNVDDVFDPSTNVFIPPDDGVYILVLYLPLIVSHGADFHLFFQRQSFNFQTCGSHIPSLGMALAYTCVFFFKKGETIRIETLYESYVAENTAFQVYRF